MSAVIAENAIQWPVGCSPAESSVHVRNEIEIAAPVEVVWGWLVRAEMWPDWYGNASEVHFTSHTGPALRDRSRFRWKTFGLRVDSKVREFEPFTRLGWDARGMGVNAWHAWVLTATAGGTHVLTEETQTGWLARLGKTLFPKRMEEQHQLWLEGLKRMAEGGGTE